MVKPYLLGWYVNGHTGTNVHAILEKYEPTVHNVGDQTNSITLDNGHSTIENSNGLPSDTAEDNNIDHLAAIQDISRLPGSTGTRRRRLFIFSANDKVALRRQMLDTGTSHR